MPKIQPTLLAFHKVQESFSYGVTNFPPDRLESLLRTLIKHGYELCDSPDGPAPGSEAQPHIRLSFDDGYAHLKDFLPRLVSEFKTRPIVFIPTHWIGRSNRWDYSSRLQPVRHLNREEIRNLARDGVEFGSHGVGHSDLTSFSESQLRLELTESRKLLQDITGQPVDAMSYPFGRFNARVTEAVQNAGYKFGYGMQIPSGDESTHATGRIPVYSFDSPRVILRRLQSPSNSWERLKTVAVNRLSLSTVWLNRLRDVASKRPPQK